MMKDFFITTKIDFTKLNNREHSVIIQASMLCMAQKILLYV